MNEADAARTVLQQAMVNAGAARDTAKQTVEKIAGLANDHAAWFGSDEPDSLAVPLHQGRLYWLKQLGALAVKIGKASGDAVLDADGNLDPPSMALRALQARLQQTAPQAWPQFVAALKTVYSELESQAADKPRRSDDRATRRLFVQAALAWREGVGKWPPITKREQGGKSSATFVDTPLLAALRSLVGKPAARALSDDKFERAIALAKRLYNQGEGDHSVRASPS